MAMSASLVQLCQQAMAELANRDAAKRKELFLLPPDLLADIVPLISPLALESLQSEPGCKLSIVENCGKSHAKQSYNVKRSFDAMMNGGSFCCLNAAWKNQFDKRWPSGFKKLRFDTLLSSSEVEFLNFHYEEASLDWRSCFWETHLQECLNEAIAQISMSHFQGPLCNLTLSNRVSQINGCELVASEREVSATHCLKYNCQQFGKHARYLRLRGALCARELSILLSTCTRLEHIVCSHIDTTIQVEGLCLLLSQNTVRLNVLEFQHCRFPEDGLLKISSSLKVDGMDHCLLQHLFVHSSRALFPRSSHSSLFMFFLHTCSYLRSLVLIDNQVDLVTASKLFSTISTGTLQLSLFHIRENELTGFTALPFQHLPQISISSSLRALDIRSNNISSQDIKEFLSFFHNVPLLELLNLSDNPIGDEALLELLPLLQVLQLSELSLSACNLTMKGACLLLDILINTSRFPLRSLNLSHNRLGSSMAGPLANLLCHGIVERLDIGDIGLGASGCVGFQNALEEIPNLSHLVVRKNRLGSAGAALFGKLLAMPNSLKVIDFGSNLLDRQCLQSMAFQLNLQGGTLELVDLRNNLAEDLKIFVNIRKPEVLLSEVGILYDDDP